MYLGIDIGGTHTDAVLVDEGSILAAAKTATRHDDLLSSVVAALDAVLADHKGAELKRLTLSTTLTTNAIVENKIEEAGVLVAPGPGLPPLLSRMPGAYHVLPGAMDHRGHLLAPLGQAQLRRAVADCRLRGIAVYACVGKFSTRNPAFEQAMAAAVAPMADYVAQGHELSGQLGFPRRIATATLNANVWRLFNRFADAIHKALVKKRMRPRVSILKADGGTLPLSMARHFPVESILSGPAASVMGVMALSGLTGDALMLDIGGTTTDIALFVGGAPLLEPAGIAIAGHPTHVRALLTRSIGVGGDSAISVEQGMVRVGPQRHGAAVAMGGPAATLVDALNVGGYCSHGDVAASRAALAELAEKARSCGHTECFDALSLAEAVVSAAVAGIREAVAGLLAEVNARPVYTIYEMLDGARIKPQRVFCMGGPAQAMADLLSEAFAEPVVVPEHYNVANALGAAVSRPTMAVELHADTALGHLTVPAVNVEEAVERGFSLDDAKKKALSYLHEYVGHLGLDEQCLEITQAQQFNMVENDRLTGHNIRVAAQIRPGILPGFSSYKEKPCPLP